MASHRFPKGSYVRGTPDWFSDQLYFAAAVDQRNYSNSGSSFATFSLFNDDTTGRQLQIFAINLYYDGALGAVFDFYPGTYGTLAAQGRSVKVDGASGPGAAYLHASVVPTPPPFQNPDIANPIGQLGGAATGLFTSSDFPLWIIPTGWSIRFSNSYNSVPNGFTVWYVPLAN